MTVFEILLRGLLIVAGLSLPGWGWAFGARWPVPCLAAGVVSSLAIFAGVLTFTLLGIPVSVGPLTAWLSVVAGLGFVWWRTRAVWCKIESTDLAGWWLAMPALPMLVVAVIRAVGHPLAGADTVFRWDHLARMIVHAGHLDFYPPVEAEGFTVYFWADGIAPLVSSLYVWTYLAADSFEIRWTAIPVLAQVAGLVVLLFGLGRLWGGNRAGWFAIALGGATMMLQFAFGLGQETGLTALGAGGMVLYLMHWRRSGQRHLLIPAAACAALASCAREYGGAFMLAGFAWVWSSSASWKLGFGFLLGAGLLPAAWHLRNWLLTGNPFYAHDIAGLFPLNPVFTEWMSGYVETNLNTMGRLAGWMEIGRLLLMSAFPAFLGFLGGMTVWRGRSDSMGWISLGILCVSLWLVSVPYTGGGIFYSLRVTSPLLVLGCAWGGGVLAQLIPGRRHLAGLLVALSLYGLDASLRAWTIPSNPYSIPVQEWPASGYQMQLDFARFDHAFIESVARRVPGKVLSDSAGLQPIFHAQGRKLIPFWSPEVDFLFSPMFKGDVVRRLHELGFTHILLKRAPFTVDFLMRTGAMERLGDRLDPAMANDTFILLSLKPPPESLQPPSPTHERK